ncbi:MAG TPA: GntR family transcriptional regulator [Planctomycetota bacterium]|nr:GntR family transcriptional regulator [Planctomycetota bacterium]
MPRPATRPTLAHRAYEDLKSLLLKGDYSPGDFLTEGELARRLRMSKTPVRTALTRLEMDGFVTVSPQQGIVVREPSIQEVIDLFDIRIALETFVARRLATSITPQQVEQLRANLNAQSKAVKAQDNTLTTKLDTEFHLMLCDFAGNQEIRDVMERLRSKLHRIILGVQNKNPERILEGMQEHASIAEAIVQGKADEAAQRVVHHLEIGKKFLVSPQHPADSRQ